MERVGYASLILLAMMSSDVSLSSAGDEHVSLVDFATANGLSRSMQSTDFISFCSDLRRFSFHAGSRKVLLDGIVLYMNGPAVYDSRWLVTRTDAESMLLPLLDGERRHRATPPLTVVLDPGHGGMDSGAVGERDIHEKELVLDIARCVRRRLRGCGAEVKLTRERDQAMTLSARGKQAKKWGADVFVSIHLNAAANSGARGVESYVLPAAGYPSTSGGTNHEHSHAGNRYDQSSIRLASYVHKGMLAATGAPDRGVRRARYQVLREAPCPAVLVECGFVTNPNDAGNLVRRSYRESMARGIAEGVLTFIGRALKLPAIAAP